MILYLDTSGKDKIILQLKTAIGPTGKILSRQTIPVFRTQAEKLLPGLQAFLKKNQLALKNLKGIETVTQGSSFTALRIGIATANALAYALNIPIFSVDAPEALKKKGRLRLLSPQYDREPQIGQKK